MKFCKYCIIKYCYYFHGFYKKKTCTENNKLTSVYDNNSYEHKHMLGCI